MGKIQTFKLHVYSKSKVILIVRVFIHFKKYMIYVEYN